jgi:protein-L-isoaspartate(D-aspartate) O-methyltransferase
LLKCTNDQCTTTQLKTLKLVFNSGAVPKKFSILPPLMKPVDDTYRHKGLRKKLVDGIRDKGITDEAVLTALNSLPRHFFLDSAFIEVAYEDRAFPIDEGQTISQPYTVAYQTQLLEMKPFEKVLEIGTGSAYQACILGEMKAQVYTIERQKKLYTANRDLAILKKYPNVKCFFGDGFEGLPTYGPFDKILITAAAPIVPPKLVAQLKPGGCMVLPLGGGDVQTMHRIWKMMNGDIHDEVFQNFSFVPMLAGKN